MKKNLQLIVFALLFLVFSSNIKAETKDFCKTGQKYLFNDCEDILIQCSYFTTFNGEPANYYVNIDKSYTIKAILQTEDDGWYTSTTIRNWGNVNDYTSFDAKNWFKNSKTCPKYISTFTISNDDHYYLVNDKNSLNQEKIPTEQTISYINLTSESINKTSGKDENDNNSKYPAADSCAGFKDKNTCKVGKSSTGDNFGCAWNEKYGFCSPNGLAYISCGTGANAAYDIPKVAPQLTSYVIMALKTVTPIVLIIMGMFQLVKAIASQKEDEIKKARGSLIKKVIAAVIIFFTISIFQFVVDKVADNSEQSSMRQCLKCFLNGDCKGSSYYTDGYGNCYNISNNKKMSSCPGKK